MVESNYKNNGLLQHDLYLMKNKILQAPQILKQQFNVGVQVVDLQFNELATKFNSTRMHIRSLHEACKRYKLTLHSFFYSSVSVLEVFHKLLDGVPMECHMNPDGTAQMVTNNISAKQRASEFLQEFYSIAGIEHIGQKKIDISRLNKQLQVVSKKVEQDLEFFDLHVLQPLVEVDLLCSKTSRYIDYRDLKNLEVSSLNDKCDSLKKLTNNNTKTLTSKQEVERMRSEKKLKTISEDFELINNKLKNELPIFFDSINTFLQNWFSTYYFTTLRISYALYTYTSNSPELKRIIGTEENEPNKIMNISTPDILSQFHQTFDYVLNEVENLKITDFNNLYRSILSDCESNNRMFM
ncbi:hypothetical protein Kpol_520p30 [Vanderwaltozyma polyspora DSM 70294]|uniref:BAR domain-containing protein n=1 Tax=Vanderwaltozyma polyspora (strain ATCC 22028 / DSM 70294 / BCRC 21397 / CBS 2163 / NBRC 10782 / NRRL Y-8283 / UCD 57-17) TaxID=436907 RepID=A7TMB3_VANPO|nr:uncharacterized protein Kpol_520p30 [Vanderwaltozyma polyspora DSM 70294]EDO16607.1 hypothetical protein Kpol_520p30 [Vanderwaltozyma polyspora DSM 70294]